MPAAVAFNDDIDVPGERSKAFSRFRGDGKLSALREGRCLETESEPTQVCQLALDSRTLATKPHCFYEPRLRHAAAVIENCENRFGSLPRKPHLDPR